MFTTFKKVVSFAVCFLWVAKCEQAECIMRWRIRWVSLHVFALQPPWCWGTCFPVPSVIERARACAHTHTQKERKWMNTTISWTCNTETVFKPLYLSHDECSLLDEKTWTRERLWWGKWSVQVKTWWVDFGISCIQYNHIHYLEHTCSLDVYIVFAVLIWIYYYYFNFQMAFQYK